jgi:hypothetical protein
VRKILKDGALDCDQEFYDSQRDGGNFLSRTTPIILKNYPKEAYIGMTISQCRAMRLPNKPGDTVNTYDYGLPNTPENRKTLINPPAINNSSATNTNAQKSVAEKGATNGLPQANQK